MGKWFPWVYGIAMKPLERSRFKKIRTMLINKAVGRVLEIGSGSGVNFPYYRNVDQVDAIEPNPIMRELTLKYISRSHTQIRIFSAEAEKLPFDDNTFDSVVATLVFCTIPDPVKAFEEIQRVSKPGAKILLFEHVRMNHQPLAKMQDILTPLWRKACDGCHLNRDTLRLLGQTEIAINQVDYYYKGLFVTVEAINDK
ncbi:class I SAM-dependent methyltransferase [Virgibacillus necropolis]|uniref:SAM-dependent methyltransferase n=1 Tax=Virgibacillus necropolis TaxID=163877 RepID=A0A221MAW5_9BACI|nr:class I SAM-dependent methyltransferase [Virgibacillus necropolis]ASN04806.1 SAM-dependent methyltransferase [Virgibacillus necropolis]